VAPTLLGKQQMIHIKSNFCGDIHRFSFQASSSFASLSRKLRQVHKIEDEQEVGIFYRDQDEDWVTLSSDVDLEPAFDIASKTQTLTIRVRARCSFSRCSKKFVGVHKLHLGLIGVALFYFFPICFLFKLTLLLIAGLAFGLFKTFKNKCSSICGAARQNCPINVIRQVSSAINGTGPQQPQPPKDAPHWDKFKENVATLTEMGWKDTKQVINALIQSEGDLEGALQLLVH